MLVTVVLPFCDFRSLVLADFQPLARPRWPTPVEGHMRGIGGVKYRNLRGFASWVGEETLVVGLPAIRLCLAKTLPKALDGTDRKRVRLVRRSCHFDGLLCGRFEFLFDVSPDADTEAEVLGVVRSLLATSVQIPRIYGHKTRSLADASSGVAWLWARARVRRADTSVQHVRAGRPFVVVDNGSNLGPTPAEGGVGAKLAVANWDRQREIFVLYPPAGEFAGPASSYRAKSRTLRTYLIRLLQAVETISQICELAGSMKGIDPSVQAMSEDRVQLYVNEYTRHIMRSSANIPDSHSDLVDYCYAAFSRLYPGRIEGLRSQVIACKMRPNVKSKLLQLLDHTEKAATRIENFFVGELKMIDNGDKFENVTVTGQGIAIGRGSSSTVSNSQNAPLDHQLIVEMQSLAELVRKADHPDAEVEADCIAAAVKKAEIGDEKGAVGILRKSGKWALDLATKVGSGILHTYLQSKLGL